MLKIPMTVVLALGENRLQLECLCGQQFTFAPENEINCTPERLAKCPKCKAIWDGDAESSVSSTTMLKPNYYAVYIRFEDDDINQQLGINEEPDGLARFAVGMGVDFAHYAIPVILHLTQKYKLVAVMIRQIDKPTFEEARQRSLSREQSKMFATLGMLTSLSAWLKEKEEEEEDGGSGDQDDCNRRKE